MRTLDLMGKRWRCRPSTIMGIEDGLVAWIVDWSAFNLGVREEKPSSDQGTRDRLDQLRRKLSRVR